ncbi:MAG: (2Fe-2S) ferredoxin domain-containing protein [Proteobacteria bacterium]|nr:(2Fe-2S) ferredoxin domain-containing protein [Pseudomonadota bacterium]
MSLYEKHIFVCENQRPEGDPRGCCFSKGAQGLTAELKKLAADAGLGKKVRINKAGCLGQCAFGTAVVVYPDAVWHRNVPADGAQAIFEQHLAPMGNK